MSRIDIYRGFYETGKEAEYAGMKLDNIPGYFCMHTDALDGGSKFNYEEKWDYVRSMVDDMIIKLYNQAIEATKSPTKEEIEMGIYRKAWFPLGRYLVDSGCKVEVKGRKAYKRGELPQDEHLFLEIKDVAGGPGFLYGKNKKLGTFWMLDNILYYMKIERVLLADWVDRNINKNLATIDTARDLLTPQYHNGVYRRQGTTNGLENKDEVCIMPFTEVLKLPHELILV